MKNGEVQIGIIGAGNIAQNAHIPAILQMKGVKLAAVYDIHAKRSAEVAEKYGMKNCPNIEALLSIDTLDAVSVCTWNNGHAPSAIAASKAGKHVFCEKPMSITVAEAEEMEKAAKQSGKIFMMGFVNRYKPESRYITDLRNKGEFGEIYYARTSLLRRRGTPLGWFTDVSKSGGGPVIDLGVHIIDITWYLMGKPKPVSVTASADYSFGDYKTKGVGRWEALDTDNTVFNCEDSAAGTITFEKGKRMNFDVSWAINGESDMNTYLYGEKAGATLFPLTIYGEHAEHLTDNRPIFEEENPFFNELSHFADCIRGEAQPISPAEDGVAVQKILCGIYASAKAGKTVEI